MSIDKLGGFEDYLYNGFGGHSSHVEAALVEICSARLLETLYLEPVPSGAQQSPTLVPWEILGAPKRDGFGVGLV